MPRKKPDDSPIKGFTLGIDGIINSILQDNQRIININSPFGFIPSRVSPNNEWVTKGGKRIRPSSMRNGHLINSLGLLVRGGAGSFNMTVPYRLLYSEAIIRNRGKNPKYIPISQLTTKMGVSNGECCFCSRPLQREEIILGKPDPLDLNGLPLYTVDGYLLLDGEAIHTSCLKAVAMAEDGEGKENGVVIKRGVDI